MSETKRCPQCQAEIPAGAPEGLCPPCLLRAALDSKTADAEPKTAAYSPSGSRFVPPMPEALQAAFPQLEILELLGKGGMGAVYKARQPGLDRLVAVKILPPEVSQDPAFAERFTREARALAKLSHPNIVGVYDFGQASGYCFFVMEYVDGVNLRQAMRAGSLKAAEALKIVPQICDALQFAHDEGIVHRDIKPENILLDKRGRVKIADFGLAKLLGKAAHDVSLTGTQQVMGTMHYMAPEQFEGSRDVDHRADIYSLGVTFYEMLTGELPIGRFAAPSKKVQIDVRLDEVVLRSLEKEPELRYQHASEIKTDVEGIVGTPAPAVGAPADELEQAVLKHCQAFNELQAVEVYRDRTGADLKDAMVAVEAIAKKYGIQFQPVPLWAKIIAGMVLAAYFAFLGLCLWVYVGLGPIIAIPLMLLVAAPSVVTAWKKWGTREGYQAAVLAGIILLTPVGFPLVNFLVNPEPTLNHLYALTGTTPGPHDALFVQGLFWGGLAGLLIWLVWFLRKSVAERRAGVNKNPMKPQAPPSLEKAPEHGVRFPTLRLWTHVLTAMILVIFAIFYLWAFGPNMITLVLVLATFAFVLAWKQKGTLKRGSAASHFPSEATTPAKAPLPKHPWGVPILGAFNVFVAVILLFVTAGEFLFPDEIPANIAANERLRQLYEIWRMGDAIGSYIAALACFIAGIGMMLWLPWARRVTVATAVLLIAKFVLEIPALVAFVIQPTFAELPEIVGPDPAVQALAVAFMVIVFSMLVLLPLIYNIAVLIYLTRPRIIAAFELKKAPEQGYLHVCEVKTETIAQSDAAPKPEAAASQPSGPARRIGYLRLVVLPVGLLFALLFLIEALLFLIEAFIPFSPPGPPQDAQPQTIVLSIGFILILLVFLVLNGVWIAKHPHAAKIMRGFLIAGWTALCVALFVIFWTPVDRNSDWHPYSFWNEPIGSIDREYWPYHGISDSTVSLAPAAPIYRRLVIREEAEANIRGYGREDLGSLPRAPRGHGETHLQAGPGSVTLDRWASEFRDDGGRAPWHELAFPREQGSQAQRLGVGRRGGRRLVAGRCVRRRQAGGHRCPGACRCGYPASSSQHQF
jgi:predicted Ser/Thr protein kinase